MKFTFIVCVLAVLAAMALALTPAQRQHFQQIVHEVNNKQSGWVAELPETLMDSDYTSIQKMMGALRLPEGVNVLPVITHDEIDIASVPTDFDAATDLRWTECADILSTIPDQSACGSYVKNVRFFLFILCRFVCIQLNSHSLLFFCYYYFYYYYYY